MREHMREHRSSIIRQHMPRTDARTDALTQMHSTEMTPSTNASRAGGQRGFFVYLIVWPETRLLKAGFARDARRWKYLVARRKDGRLLLLAQFPTEALAMAYEATLLAILAHIGTRAFKDAAQSRLEVSLSVGYSECYRVQSLGGRWDFPLPPYGVVVLGRCSNLDLRDHQSLAVVAGGGTQ